MASLKDCTESCEGKFCVLADDVFVPAFVALTSSDLADNLEVFRQSAVSFPCGMPWNNHYLNLFLLFQSYSLLKN